MIHCKIASRYATKNVSSTLHGYRQSLNKDLVLNGKKNRKKETASYALVTDYNYLIIQLKKLKSSVVTILEGSKFYFQIEDISIWHDTPSELLLTFVLKKSSGQDGQLCYGSEPPCAPNRHWHCHSFSGLLGRSLDNPRSCNYLRVSTAFYPYTCLVRQI